MISNPYKYTGALDPFDDQLVCVDRTKEVQEVIRGFNVGDYWAILGPRQIGKTTFLRQLRKAYLDAYHISVDLISAPPNEEAFYKSLIEKVKEEIPVEPPPFDEKWKSESPGNRFHLFLKAFEPKVPKKIIFLFDEIEELPYMRDFLHMWRHVHEESSTLSGAKLDIAVVISGSVDLVEATTGKTSPFNIAKHIFLHDFSREDAEKLIVKPLEQMNIRIDEDAEDYLLSELNGHPQLLQHSCSRLVEIVSERQDRKINLRDAEEVLEALMRNNTCIDLLRNDLKKNKMLNTVLQSIARNGKVPFKSYTELYVGGAGAITEDKDRNCTIRNNLFRRFMQYYMAVIPPRDDKPPVHSQLFVCGNRKDEIWHRQFSRFLNPGYKKVFVEWEEFKDKPITEVCGILEERIDQSELSIFLISDELLSPGQLVADEILAMLTRKTKDGKNIFLQFVSGGEWELLKNLSGESK